MLTASLIVLTGCVATSEKVEQNSEKLAQVNSNIVNLEKSITEQISLHCQQDNQELAKQLAVEITQQQASVNVDATEPEVVYVERCSIKDKKTNIYTNKLLLGSVETVFLNKEKLSFDARIDTGAVTSSIGVYNETRFERDGKDWLRFNLTNSADAKTYEYPVYRIIRIIQQTSTETNRRPVVKLKFALGGKSYTSEFSLANRDHLQYQVLIGREFLRDIAVVDVSSEHLLSRK
ncbi:hypothetical protein ND16A_2134 [Thalassotalea sp. ND16A]|nr:hypothetical protein ND16A_2134 [Thalassotalea sp. ND16A]